jgi:hypothetical protein
MVISENMKITKILIDDNLFFSVQQSQSALSEYKTEMLPLQSICFRIG